MVKNSPASAGDAGSVPGLERSPGAVNGNPLQYSCLGNTKDRGAWWATAHRVPRESDMTQQLNKKQQRYRQYLATASQWVHWVLLCILFSLEHGLSWCQSLTTAWFKLASNILLWGSVLTGSTWMTYSWETEHLTDLTAFLWLLIQQWEQCQSCSHVQLCDLTECSPPGSFVHGVLQAWILEWLPFFFSRGSSWPRDRT